MPDGSLVTSDGSASLPIDSAKELALGAQAVPSQFLNVPTSVTTLAGTINGLIAYGDASGSIYLLRVEASASNGAASNAVVVKQLNSSSGIINLVASKSSSLVFFVNQAFQVGKWNTDSDTLVSFSLSIPAVSPLDQLYGLVLLAVSSDDSCAVHISEY